MKLFLKRVLRVALLVWIFCILSVIAVILYVVSIRKELFDQTPDMFASVLFGFIFLGSIAFFIGIVSLTAWLRLRKSKKKQNIVSFLIILLLTIFILPLYLFLYALSPLKIIRILKNEGINGLRNELNPKRVLLRAGALAGIALVILPIWISGYTFAGILAFGELGYLEEPILIAGTGSMHPTFPKGQGNDQKELANQVVGTPGMFPYPNGIVIAGKRYFGHQIGRGDIVVIENDVIRETTKKVHGEAAGWVKRVIGLPGDTIELRDGIVYVNGKPLKEPYIARPRSTFGQDFLRECKQATVPENSIFVMGDNRKGSGDSREIGFIGIDAVNHILPLKNQIGHLDTYWRDTAKDLDEASKITLNTKHYIKLLNEKRKEAGVKPLTYQPKLELSAEKRGEVILKFDDFSFEATRSGYTMEKAMQDARYLNTTWGEAKDQGYFEAEELIENQFEFPESKKFLLDKNFQEIGIAEVEGEINGCPTQVIVQHFAGYVPPNYNKEDIEGWKKLLSRLHEIQPGWAEFKEFKEVYDKNKQDVDRINEIISLRISNISAIVTRMEANQWFTASEERMIDQDIALSDEQASLAKKLNSL